MKAIILAAGYATRLYPLTLSQPKPLLSIAGRPMIDYTLDSLREMKGLDGVVVVSNAKFVANFQEWAAVKKKEGFPFAISILNDGSTEDANKKGAIGDLFFALEQAQINDDLIVIAGDNLFTESVGAFAEFARTRKTPVLAVYDVKSLEAAKKFSVFTLASDGHIVDFEEKPQAPKSTLIGIALYYYPQETLALIRQYVAEGNNPDQPGRLIQWLYPKVSVYTWAVPGVWYDIGSKETLEEAEKTFSAVPRVKPA
ncbi:MAG: nucleotidyltransferase family protein [Candidatus Liptonbacteria bacterium]|nr:nucleotidyltransferase family protein [Candidatus Liptonbacteria bacterium]